MEVFRGVGRVVREMYWSYGGLLQSSHQHIMEWIATCLTLSFTPEANTEALSRVVVIYQLNICTS